MKVPLHREVHMKGVLRHDCLNFRVIATHNIWRIGIKGFPKWKQKRATKRYLQWVSDFQENANLVQKGKRQSKTPYVKSLVLTGGIHY